MSERSLIARHVSPSTLCDARRLRHNDTINPPDMIEAMNNTALPETPAVSISGVLRRSCCPDHLPHDDRATEAEALDAIIAHMQIDALEPRLMDPKNGPLSWHGPLRCMYAWGNFTLCSGHFQINHLSPEGYQRLKIAWLIHRESPQYKLSQELDVIHAACEKDVANVLPASFRTSYEADGRRSLIRSRYRLKSQPLEIRLQAIYERRLA